MSDTSAQPVTSLAPIAADVWATVQRILERDAVAEVPAETVQLLLTAAVKLFAAQRDLDLEVAPFLEEVVTATEVAMLCHQALRAVDLQLFELTLWQGLGKD